MVSRHLQSYRARSNRRLDQRCSLQKWKGRIRPLRLYLDRTLSSHPLDFPLHYRCSLGSLHCSALAHCWSCTRLCLLHECECWIRKSRFISLLMHQPFALSTSILTSIQPATSKSEYVSKAMENGTQWWPSLSSSALRNLPHFSLFRFLREELTLNLWVLFCSFILLLAILACIWYYVIKTKKATWRDGEFVYSSHLHASADCLHYLTNDRHLWTQLLP